MTNYTATGRSAHHTLAANTEDTVTLDRAYPYVEIENRDSSADIYVTVASGIGNATDVAVTVAADGTLHIPPLGFRRVRDDNAVSLANSAGTDTFTKVRLKSTGTPAYSVTGLFE